MREGFYFDLHVHSLYSKDSLLKPDEIIKISESKGIDAIAITDHNTIFGGLKAKSIVQDSVMVIVGSEIKTDFGDLIGLFLNEEIKSRVFLDVVDEIKEQDGIVVLPHPYRRKRFPTIEMLKNVNVIEGINGRTSDELNSKAQSLAKKLNIPSVAGSDSHFSFELGNLINCIRVSYCEEEELRKQILSNNSIFYYKKNSLLARKSCIFSSYLLKKIHIF
ncbi:PHP domain-containing protein [Methanosarcina barkeri]|uniref:PHP domain-containing protein n=1 Tax=Methanosarcina barkeri CM1 TaxID=796385 RepID=A0A0G3CGH2_METBA|nr:PHP domain-containing protein [Methanosarcina barkeri]AKJ39835.1 PHP domain-containing protein [Methanosarcina barkeri CM1]